MATCPVCGGPGRSGGGPAHAARRPFASPEFGSTRRHAEPPEIATCGRCGLGWRIAPPSPAELTRAYRAMRDDTYVAESANRIATFERGASLVARHLGPRRVDLLDVGCSAGLFLDVALRRGWNASGVEPSEWLSERARARVGNRVLTSTLEEAALGGRRFDAVTMWDVLEHVPDPRGFLESARRALRLKGLLVLNVPARDTLIARVLGRRWPLLLPEHLFYFSRKSLRILLESAGFDPLSFHQHVVFFSLPYVLQRLEQHGWPLASRAGRRVRAAGLRVPLLMGEVTVVARSRA